ncbi:MAG: ABC transporter permease [Candidatus Bathyarchaeia archaeon]
MTASQKSEGFGLPELTYRVWKVWRRNFDVFMKTFKTNFFPPLLEPIFYLAAMGTGLGALITQSIEGQSYIQFLAPALVSITIMYSSFFECTYGSFVRMYYQRTFDAIIATPISIEEVIAGEILWGATRSLVGGAIVLGVVAAFGLISSPLFLLVLPVAFFAGLMFSAIGLCFTALAPNIDFFNYPQYLFITPMFLLSSTFFPLTLLPRPLQIFAQAVLPLTHTVNLTRWSIFGSGELSFIPSLVWIAAVTPVFFVLAINLMKRRLIR